MRTRLLRPLAPPLRALASRLRRAGAVLESEVAAPLRVAPVKDEATREFLLGFESVGATCEFGLVQRRYQAEPLGLFRWNVTPWRALIRAMDRGLEGLGDPVNTVLERSKFGEFLVRDTRFGFGMNTFKRPGEVEESELLRQMCARTVFLRDKFFRDLAEGEKIFVYRLTTIDIPELEAIHDALCRFGPVRMLGVLACDGPGRPDGSILQRRAGLCVGFLRPGQFPTHWDIPFEAWVDLCRDAAARLAPP